MTAGLSLQTFFSVWLLWITMVGRDLFECLAHLTIMRVVQTTSVVVWQGVKSFARTKTALKVLDVLLGHTHTRQSYYAQAHLPPKVWSVLGTSVTHFLVMVWFKEVVLSTVKMVWINLDGCTDGWFCKIQQQKSIICAPHMHMNNCLITAFHCVYFIYRGGDVGTICA